MASAENVAENDNLHSCLSPRVSYGQVIEAEGDPVSGDVCSGHRGTGLHTVHMMDQAPLATFTDGRTRC